MESVEIVPITDVSDGDITHIPKAEWRLVTPPNIYLEKLGSLWMDSQKLARPGKRYYLDKLPAGYRLYERPRPSNAKIVDKHLYGHPSQKVFDSPNRFFPHFNYLMNNASTVGCPCTVCNGNAKAPLSIGRPAGRPAGPSKAVKTAAHKPPPAPKVRHRDSEDIPDVVRMLIDKLAVLRTMDCPITEDLSMDWRAERDTLPQCLETLSKQKSWLPRVGELVLFLRYPPAGELCLDNATNEFKIYDSTKESFTGHPRWEAGVIGQVPDETVRLQDVIQETSKASAIGTSGYRVEPLPDPNSNDKSLTKQYKYVPLHHIRPFMFWREYLKGINETQLHPTIKNALTVSASVALVNRYRFKGTWPFATIFCRGLYLGSELICAGDTVRLIPRDGDKVHSIMQIEFIKLQFSGLESATDTATDSGNSRLSIAIAGKGFTASAAHAWRPTSSPSTAPELAFPKIQGYDTWYWSHDPLKQLEVPYTRLLGRCFEAEPMLLWFPQQHSYPPAPFPSASHPTTTSSAAEKTTQTTLTYGLPGTLYARSYSSQNDTRIPPTKSWFWADSRAEALDIPSLNHVDTSYYDEVRRGRDGMEEWQKATRVLAGKASAGEVKELKKMAVEHKPEVVGEKFGLNADADADAEVGAGAGVDVVDLDGDDATTAGSPATKTTTTTTPAPHATRTGSAHGNRNPVVVIKSVPRNSSNTNPGTGTNTARGSLIRRTFSTTTASPNKPSPQNSQSSAFSHATAIAPAAPSVSIPESDILTCPHCNWEIEEGDDPICPRCGERPGAAFVSAEDSPTEAVDYSLEEWVAPVLNSSPHQQSQLPTRPSPHQSTHTSPQAPTSTHKSKQKVVLSLSPTLSPSPSPRKPMQVQGQGQRRVNSAATTSKHPPSSSPYASTSASASAPASASASASAKKSTAFAPPTSPFSANSNSQTKPTKDPHSPNQTKTKTTNNGARAHVRSGRAESKSRQSSPQETKRTRSNSEEIVQLSASASEDSSDEAGGAGDALAAFTGFMGVVGGKRRRVEKTVIVLD